MNELEIFSEQIVLGKRFKIYGSIDNPLFLAKDVADWIENSNVTMMLKTVDENEVTKQSLGKLQGECNFLTEDGLYEVLMMSRKPIAKEFKREVKNVLKTIRKTGGYVNNDELFLNTYLPNCDETTKLLFKSTLEVVRKQNELIEQQKPLVTFANTVANSSDNIDMNEMAKLIANEHIKLGRNRLFEILRSNKILMANNTPYQRYIDAKWFKLIETTKITSYGSKIFTKTLVTGLGQIKIIEMLKIMLA